MDVASCWPKIYSMSQFIDTDNIPGGVHWYWQYPWGRSKEKYLYRHNGCNMDVASCWPKIYSMRVSSLILTISLGEFIDTDNIPGGVHWYWQYLWGRPKENDLYHHNGCNVMLTENFQYESHFIDTNNIPGGDQRKIICTVIMDVASCWSKIYSMRVSSLILTISLGKIKGKLSVPS